MSAATHRQYNERAIHYAVVASIVFHGLLLSLAPKQPAQRPPALPGPIVARLSELPIPQASAPPAPAQAEPQKPQAEPVKPETTPLPPKPSPLAKPAPKAAAKADPTPPAKPSPAPSAEPAPSAPATPAAPSTPGPVAKSDPQPAAPSTAPTPSAEPSDAGSLAQYRLQLISMAKRYKRYPRVAMDNNWEGDVVVRMVIGANGMISSISVKTSSGHDVLDKQALEMFQKAKPLVPIPSALRGKEFVIEVRAIYNLKEPDSG